VVFPTTDYGPTTMPDPVELLKAMALAAGVAGAVLLILGKAGRSLNAVRPALGWPLGVGLGFFAGCLLIPDLRPEWPPAEDLDRFLLIVLPATVLVEAVAAWPRVPRWLAWLLRAALAFAAARVLLHGSTYLVQPAGPGNGEWSGEQRWYWLGGLGILLVFGWAGLELLNRKAPSRWIPLALAVVCLASAVAVMLTGYASSGQLGMPLTGALVGATLASLLVSSPEGQSAPLGVGIVSLFSLLVMGCFFAGLDTISAALLFLAPLVCWPPVLPKLRGVVQVLLATLLAAVLVFLALQRFGEEPRIDKDTTEIGAEDYMNFGR